MKVFFDTNVYVAEALLGDAAARMLEATSRASWNTDLLSLSPYEGLRILSMSDYHRLLQDHQLLA